MKELEILLIEPRGFCAGVSRAVEIVEKVLEKYPTPIYVKNEIVHNKSVVEHFKNKGVIFIKDINEVPNYSVIIYSAHGVSNKIEEASKEKKLTIIDATCPLVKKVHKESLRYYNEGSQIILVGHKGHPEVEGTFGRIPNNIYLVSNEEEAKKLQLDKTKPISYITQTTLSINDTKEIIDILKLRFPSLQGQESKNICYATQNRQNAIYNIIDKVDGLIIVGSLNSSNSNRLREIGLKYNKPSFLIDNPNLIPFEKLSSLKKIAFSAGASAPESSIKEILDAIKNQRKVKTTLVEYIKEDIVFYLPKALR